jgi:hypothetical protein
VEWGSACGPSDRELVEDGIRRCYELSGERWHGRVIWAESPFNGALIDRLPRSRTGLLWHERQWSGDPQAIGPRYPDDLRYRMDQELAELADHDLVRRVETLVRDPDRARVALAGMGEQLPRRARGRLRRQLAAGNAWSRGRAGSGSGTPTWTDTCWLPGWPRRPSSSRSAAGRPRARWRTA